MDLATGFEAELRILTDLVAHPGRIRQEDVSLARYLEESITGQLLNCGLTPDLATHLIGLILPSSPPTLQALVLTPNDDCSLFVKNRLCKVGTWKGVRCKAFLSEHSLERNQRVVSRGVHIAIGTLPAVLDLIDRQLPDLSSLSLLLFDDTDVRITSKTTESLLAKLPTPIKDALSYAIFPVPVYQEFEQKLYSLELKPRRIQYYFLLATGEETPATVFRQVYPQLKVSRVVVYAESLDRLTELQGVMVNADGKVAILRSQNSCLVHKPTLPPDVVVPKIQVVVTLSASSLLKYLLCMCKSGRFGKRAVVISIVEQTGLEALGKFAKQFDVKMKELPSDLSEVLRKMTAVDAPVRPLMDLCV